MKKHPFQNATFLLWILMLAFAPWAQSQEQTNPTPQAGAKPAKEQLKPEEPEANTSASTEALQKATQSPVASLISVPIQNNNNFGMNPGYRTQDVLNIQPVIPIAISKDWNLLVRWIMPIVWQPLPNQPGNPETGVYGLGDMVPTFFISPKKPGKLDNSAYILGKTPHSARKSWIFINGEYLHAIRTDIGGDPKEPWVNIAWKFVWTAKDTWLGPNLDTGSIPVVYNLTMDPYESTT